MQAKHMYVHILLKYKERFENTFYIGLVYVQSILNKI